jgi:hypothetical protein
VRARVQAARRSKVGTSPLFSTVRQSVYLVGQDSLDEGALAGGGATQTIDVEQVVAAAGGGGDAAAALARSSFAAARPSIAQVKQSVQSFMPALSSHSHDQAAQPFAAEFKDERPCSWWICSAAALSSAM